MSLLPEFPQGAQRASWWKVRVRAGCVQNLAACFLGCGLQVFYFFFSNFTQAAADPCGGSRQPVTASAGILVG